MDSSIDDTKSFSDNDNAFLIKTNVNGNPLWQKKHDGYGANKDTSVKQTNDSGHILTWKMEE